MAADWLAEIAAKLKIETLPESYRMVAEIVGVENTVKLSNLLGGTAFYFRKISGLILVLRDEQIRAEFNGVNHKDLARKYNLTEMHIRRILKQKPLEQLNLFNVSGNKNGDEHEN